MSNVVRVPGPPNANGGAEPDAATQSEYDDYEYVMNLTSARRNTLLYERQIAKLEHELLQSQVSADFLSKELRECNSCNASLSIDRGRLMEYQKSMAGLQVELMFATLSMAIGGALLSTFPRNEENGPYMHAVGWMFILTGVVIGWLKKLFSTLVVRRFKWFF